MNLVEHQLLCPQFLNQGPRYRGVQGAMAPQNISAVAAVNLYSVFQNIR